MNVLLSWVQVFELWLGTNAEAILAKNALTGQMED